MYILDIVDIQEVASYNIGLAMDGALPYRNMTPQIYVYIRTRTNCTTTPLHGSTFTSMFYGPIKLFLILLHTLDVSILTRATHGLLS